MKTHRWSGWPGAFCLDCGCEDPVEMAMVDNNILYEYKGVVYNDPPMDENENWPAVEEINCFINPEKRHLYPSDECLGEEKE